MATWRWIEDRVATKWTSYLFFFFFFSFVQGIAHTLNLDSWNEQKKENHSFSFGNTYLSAILYVWHFQNCYILAFVGNFCFYYRGSIWQKSFNKYRSKEHDKACGFKSWASKLKGMLLIAHCVNTLSSSYLDYSVVLLLVEATLLYVVEGKQTWPVINMTNKFVKKETNPKY